MRDYFSIFVVLPSNIIELCFSQDKKDDSIDSGKRMNVSQLLLAATTQFLVHKSHFDSHWKKWLFFVLASAIGEGFRIDSCRDYPREKFTGVNIEKFLVSEYNLTTNTQKRHFSLRIDPLAKQDFFEKIEGLENNKIKQNFNEPYLPYTDEFRKKIRTLDLQIIMKRTLLITPSLIEVQTWIISWKPINTDEFNQLNEDFVNIKELNIEELSPFLSYEEITVKGWDKYREKSLEQPWGLICPKCERIYKANLYAKRCNSCQAPLKKA